MIFVKITVLVIFVLFLWTMYVSSKLKSDVAFNYAVTTEKNYPKWYLAYIWFVFISIIMMFISLVYVLFFVL